MSLQGSVQGAACSANATSLLGLGRKPLPAEAMRQNGRGLRSNWGVESEPAGVEAHLTIHKTHLGFHP